MTFKPLDYAALVVGVIPYLEKFVDKEDLVRIREILAGLRMARAGRTDPKDIMDQILKLADEAQDAIREDDAEIDAMVKRPRGKR